MKYRRKEIEQEYAERRDKNKGEGGKECKSLVIRFEK
jgi:hypothetical protein